jgi:hypothetical protein
MKRFGVAVAGAVLAAGMAGGSAFAFPHVPNRPNNHLPANVQHCRNIARQIVDLSQKKRDAKNDHQRAAIQRHIDRLEQQLLKVCTP